MHITLLAVGKTSHMEPIWPKESSVVCQRVTQRPLNAAKDKGCSSMCCLLFTPPLHSHCMYMLYVVLLYIVLVNKQCVYVMYMLCNI
jgi:hypothetical protein